MADSLRADPGVARVGGPLSSRDGRQALLPATLKATAPTADVANRLQHRLQGDHAVALGGSAVAGTTSARDPEPIQRVGARTPTTLTYLNTKTVKININAEVGPSG